MNRTVIFDALQKDGYLEGEILNEFRKMIPGEIEILCKECIETNPTLFGDLITLITEEGGRACSPELVKVLQQCEDPQHRASLVIGIGHLGDIQAIPVLAGFLYDKDRRVKANTIESLAAIGDKSIIKLIEPFLNDPDNRIRANTAMALWDFESHREQVKEVFEKMVGDNEKWMKASAFYAFGEKRIKDFLELLITSLDDEDEDICRNAVIALIGYAEKMDPEEEGKK